MAEESPLKDVRFKIPVDLDARVKDSGKSYRDIVFEYFNGTNNGNSIPEWIFEPEKVSRISLYGYLKGLEVNDYNQKFVRYLYHRITERLEKNPGDEKLLDLKEFVIQDMTNEESPFELELVRSAMKPVIDIIDSIYSDDGLAGERKKVEAEIQDLMVQKERLTQEIDQAKQELANLGNTKVQLDQALADMQRQMDDIQNGIDERIKQIYAENESMKKTLEDYDKVRGDLANAMSTISQMKDLILQRDAEIKKLKDSYNDIFKKYDTLINKMTRKEFEKINARELPSKE
ncbi:hypothetical protein [Thermoplasma acidophilum]|uniref:Uncharacterized protein n=1 Tax=Thermoplasma acidophilum (strain ATCC 25905 / DSM 1728 / JCM 9062 / NBRC 15155 / AMRC-C165) TaxID=273075 RepID=Q9HKS8_THEAC|nr:hypothetical protein [Thermoplasma acidophilum]MCY0852385.1 hypothetical protein [Thermoplasma acidophilum]CAC11658.1 hypothetical protein [Thermoplasma acidophilum]